jgi:hypothetical protein
MRFGVVVASVFALVIVGGCSSNSPSPELEKSLTWEAPNAERVACSELFPEWSDGAPGAPAACWRHAGPSDVEEQFATHAASFSDHLGAEPLSDHQCAAAGNGAMHKCGSVWKVGGVYVTLVSSLNIEEILRVYDEPYARDFAHEMTAWVTATDPRESGTIDNFVVPLP